MVSWKDQLKQIPVQNLEEGEPGLSDEERKEADVWERVTAASPLQKLIHSPCDSKNEDKLIQQRLNALKAAREIDHEQCSSLYAALVQRTESLADKTVDAEFPWRVRVGGLLGFQEILLPVFHPTYGIPYVPASSIKGVVRSWAQKALPDKREDIDRLLGHMKSSKDRSSKGRLAAVQFLDSFPSGPCLSVDVATPQWKWDANNRVKYKPEPHPMLSMESVTLKIGIKRTSLGNDSDVNTVQKWLEKALIAEGLGGRMSAGYGRTRQALQTARSDIGQYVASKHSFELWSEGIHGISRDVNEFRPVAVRGMLRYWFRAIALGLYSPEQCRSLESELFGAIEPSAITGSLRVSALIKDEDSQENMPYMAKGHVKLEAKEEEHLRLAQHLLKLASHLGGVGQGARRPLHWNSNRFRGCYWQLTDTGAELGNDADSWTTFFKSMKHAFSDVVPLGSTPVQQHPGDDERRYQGVLNQAARIYLVPSQKLKHPEQVKDWRREGDRPKVRGAALEFFYGSGFKGDNLSNGNDANTVNKNVGGQRGIPSFVWISSNRLRLPEEAYQVMTIFDVSQDDRARFLQLLRSQRGVVQVWPVQ